MNLSQLRQQIDTIDKAMIELLSERFQLTEQVGILKAMEKMPAQDPAREELMMAKIAELAEAHGLRPDVAMSIYRSIIDLVISRHHELEQGLTEIKG